MMLFFGKRKESKILYIFIIFRRRLDVSSIRSGAGNLRHFSMTMVSYGYFGDLMRRSERWKELNLHLSIQHILIALFFRYRWLGPYRYDVSGLHTFLANRGYKGDIEKIP